MKVVNPAILPSITVTQWDVSDAPSGRELVLKFSYNDDIVSDVKKLAGCRYDPQTKEWTIRF